MSRFVFAPPPVTALPVRDQDGLFPVHRVYCIGRNYADHAREMGHDPDREPPFFFQKNPDNLDLSGRFPFPAHSREVHHEAELAIALGSGGSDIDVRDALSCVFGYALALDMTRRDLQAEAKKAGRPWEVAKAFEHSAPIGPLHPAALIGHPDRGRITLTVNGVLRQDGDLAQMIWSVPEIISCLSRYFHLQAGDVILTGTPAGVGPVSPGDVMTMALEPLGTLTVEVV